MPPRILVALASLCTLLACDPIGPADDDASTGDTGDASGPFGPDDAEGYALMESCALAQVCETFVHLRADGALYHDAADDAVDGAGQLAVERCILTNLRDGTPGRYVYAIDGTYLNGEELATFLIHVHADRTVTYARHRQGVLIDDRGEQPFDVHEPARTCTLASPALFTDCLDGASHDSCFGGTTWWSACAEQGPSCE
jgi:hypothetical protein